LAHRSRRDDHIGTADIGVGGEPEVRGGRATDDAVRSLLISSWLLGTREFLVIHHTDCGMEKSTDEAMAEIIAERCGEDVSELDFLTSRDLDQSVRDDVDRIRSLGQIPADAMVSGHVYDVRTGTLREVPAG
jgi:carbonic anhydrase